MTHLKKQLSIFCKTICYNNHKLSIINSKWLNFLLLAEQFGHAISETKSKDYQITRNTDITQNFTINFTQLVMNPKRAMICAEFIINVY